MSAPMNTDAAREAARQDNGQFGTQAQAEAAGVQLTDHATFFPSAPLTDNDRQVLADYKGVFESGHTSEDINRVLGRLESARLVCVWDVHDEWGYGGNSNLAGIAMGSKMSGPLGVGRAVPDPKGSWRAIHRDAWDYLYEPDSDIQVDDLTTLLADEVYTDHDDLDDMAGDGFHNVAVTDEDEEEICRADDCDDSLDDGEGYDGYCGTHADKVAKHEDGGHRPVGELDDDDEPAAGPDDDCPEC